MKLTVFFDGQYWIGIFELIDSTCYQSYRYVFGAEPNESVILEFINNKILHLFNEQKSSFTLNYATTRRKYNPKKMKRIISKERKKKNISTKAQQFISYAKEQQKKDRKEERKRKDKEMKEIIRLKKIKQKKEKKKGR